MLVLGAAVTSGVASKAAVNVNNAVQFGTARASLKSHSRPGPRPIRDGPYYRSSQVSITMKKTCFIQSYLVVLVPRYRVAASPRRAGGWLFFHAVADDGSMGRISALICCFPPLCLSEDEIVLAGAITRIVTAHRIGLIDFRIQIFRYRLWSCLFLLIAGPCIGRIYMISTPIRPTLQYLQ